MISLTRRAYNLYLPRPFYDDSANVTFESLFPDIELRQHQIEALEGLDSHRRTVLLHHRRAGKDVLAFLWCVYRAIKYPVTTHHYYFPLKSLADSVICQSMGTVGGNLVSLVPRAYLEKFDKTKLVIYLKNGSSILVRGLDKTLNVGVEGITFIFSEYALAKDHEAHDYVSAIWQAEAVRQRAKIVYISTPRGFNHFYDKCEEIKNDENGFFHKVTVEDTNLVTKETLDELRRDGVNEDTINQEYFCTFEREKENRIYLRLMDIVDYEGRIRATQTDGFEKIHTAWDLGVADPTIIIFFRIKFNLDGFLNIEIVDYIEEADNNLNHFMKLLFNKNYNYGTHFLPHDANQRDKITAQAFSENFLDCLDGGRHHYRYDAGSLTVLRPESILYGIQTVCEMFKHFVFDEKKTKVLRRKVELYKWKILETDGEIKRRPLHDNASHACDALRYMVHGIVSMGLNKQSSPRGHGYITGKQRW